MAFGQTAGTKDVSYKVEYMVVTEKCHYCGKEFSIVGPSNIYDIQGNQDKATLVEAVRLYMNKIDKDLMEFGDKCTSTKNRSTKHLFLERENTKKKYTKSYSMSIKEADNYVEKVLPDDYNSGVLKQCIFIATNAAIK